MAVDARGVVSGLIIAPAFGAAACVAGMMVLAVFYMTFRGQAIQPLG